MVPGPGKPPCPPAEQSTSQPSRGSHTAEGPWGCFRSLWGFPKFISNMDAQESKNEESKSPGSEIKDWLHYSTATQSNTIKNFAAHEKSHFRGTFHDMKRCRSCTEQVSEWPVNHTVQQSSITIQSLFVESTFMHRKSTGRIQTKNEQYFWEFSRIFSISRVIFLSFLNFKKFYNF